MKQINDQKMQWEQFQQNPVNCESIKSINGLMLGQSCKASNLASLKIPVAEYKNAMAADSSFKSYITKDNSFSRLS